MKTNQGLGDLESAIMQVLWNSQSALSVRDVHGALTDRELAYTTVMTVLDRLSKKGLVGRERDGRAWRYTPTASREQLTAQTLRSTLGSLEPGDRQAALLHFLDDASPAEIDDLREALANLERKHR